MVFLPVPAAEFELSISLIMEIQTRQKLRLNRGRKAAAELCSRRFISYESWSWYNHQSWAFAQEE